MLARANLIAQEEDRIRRILAQNGKGGGGKGKAVRIGDGKGKKKWMCVLLSSINIHELCPLRGPKKCVTFVFDIPFPQF